MSWLRKQFRTIEAIFVWWRDGLTPAGKTVSLFVIAGFPALAAVSMPLYVAVFGGLSLLVVCSWISFLDRPRLRISARPPELITNGDEFSLHLKVENLRSRPAFELSFKLSKSEGFEQFALEGDSPVSLAGAGATQSRKSRLSFACKSKRRGVYRMPEAVVSTTFPLNLRRRTTSFKIPGEIIIAPAYTPVEIRTFLSGTDDAGEDASETLRSSAETEYFGGREYVPGMPVRRWDYSSWARLGRPVVREYHDLCRPAVTVVLDPSCEFSHDELDTERFERRVSTAASLCAASLSAGIDIDRIICGDDSLKLPPDSAEHQLYDALRFLASVSTIPSYDCAAAGTELEESGFNGHIFVVADKESGTVEHLVSRLENKGLNVTVVGGNIDAYACEVVQCT